MPNKPTWMPLSNGVNVCTFGEKQEDVLKAAEKIQMHTKASQCPVDKMTTEKKANKCIADANKKALQ